MDNWYYVDDKGQRQGPLTGEALAELFNARGIHAATLAWREGLSEWLPLSGFLGELGLETPATPPALPPLAAGHLPSIDPQPSPWPASPAPQSDPRETTPDKGFGIVYAGFWRRYLALFIDQVVMGIPLLLLAGAIGYKFGLFEGSGEDAGILIEALYVLIYLVIAPLYYALQESSRHQATLGKRALGIKVTDLEGNRIGFTHALGRWFAAALSYLTMYIGFLLAAFTPRKQALHDMVAGTLVTDKWAFTAYPERQKHGLSGCLIAILVVLVAGIPVVAILAAMAVPAYQQYMIRSQIGQALSTAEPLKLAVSEFQSEHDRCPSNGEDGLGDAGSYATNVIASIQIGPSQNDTRCSIQVTLKSGPNGALGGKHISLEQDASAGTWHCASDMEDRNLPSNCRG